MLIEVKLAHPVCGTHPAHLPLPKPFGTAPACWGTGVAGGDALLMEETTPCTRLVAWLKSPLASYGGVGKGKSLLFPTAERSRGAH